MRRCDNGCILQNSESSYIRWLVGVLGPVFMGSKPAELISFPRFDTDKDNKLDLIIEHFKICKKIKYRVVRLDSGSIRVLFYNPISLEKSLTDYRNYKFLCEKGYPTDYQFNSYIDFILIKLREGEMPHEIGVFLGYPLKDIIGFLGHPSLKLTKVNGWRVYGNPRLSDMKYNAFMEDREHVARLLETSNVSEVLYMM